MEGEEPEEDTRVQTFSSLMSEMHFSIFAPKGSVTLLGVQNFTSATPQMVLDDLSVCLSTSRAVVRRSAFGALVRNVPSSQQTGSKQAKDRF